MRISGVTMWGVRLDLKRSYRLSGGRLLFEHLDSTIIRVDTDEGVSGWGESCPWGSSYLPAFAGGVRAGIAELAPAVVGMDPRQTDVVYRAMNLALPGHGYVKTAIDMACWDIAAQSAGLPLVDMLGGRSVEKVRLNSSISSGTAEELLAEIDRAREGGYTMHSAKIGADPESDAKKMRFLAEQMGQGEDVTFDCNRSWTTAQAIAVLNETRELTNVIEQPCETYEQILHVRRHVSQPLAIDESLVTLGDALRMAADGACEVAGVKVGRVGGLTPARRIRDVCLEAGILMNIEDTGGTRLQASAAVALASTLPEPFPRATWLCFNQVVQDPVPEGVVNENGWASAPTVPGIGAVVDEGALGEPLEVFK